MTRKHGIPCPIALPALLPSLLLAVAPTALGAAQADEPAAGTEAQAVPELAYTPKNQREFELQQVLGDFHVAVVGEEIITRSEVIAYIKQSRLKEDPTLDRTDLDPNDALEMQFFAAMGEIIDARLKTNGGRNLGYEPELIAGATQRQLDRIIQSWGGEQEATERLKGMGWSPDRLVEYLEETMLSQYWEDAVTGNGFGASGRLIVDNYVRPGEMYARYRDYATSGQPDLMKIVGKTRGSVSVQQLLIQVSAPGKEGEALREIEAYRANIENGILDFDKVVTERAAVGYRGERSYTRNQPPDVVNKMLLQIHEGSEKELTALMKSPKAGDLSPVFTIGQGNQVQAYCIYRILDWAGPTELSPFVSLKLQAELGKTMREEHAKMRVDQALARQTRSTHVSPEPIRRALLDRGRRAPKQDR